MSARPLNATPREGCPASSSEASSSARERTCFLSVPAEAVQLLRLLTRHGAAVAPRTVQAPCDCCPTLALVWAPRCHILAPTPPRSSSCRLLLSSARDRPVACADGVRTAFAVVKRQDTPRRARPCQAYAPLHADSSAAFCGAALLLARAHLPTSTACALGLGRLVALRTTASNSIPIRIPAALSSLLTALGRSIS